MKIFKLFVSIALILSISLMNSFAAISVSDGSAFVTKAEFAADLNNLSNRMSSLENSLDAKIDSLVSSYLSRNGIWNGEKQENSNSYIRLGSSITFTTDFNNRIYPLYLNHKLMTLSKTGLVKLCLYSNTRIYMIGDINQTGSLTGLLTFSLFFNRSLISGLTLNTWYVSSATTANSMLNGNLSTWKFADLIENDNASGSRAYLIGRPMFQEFVYFFANKGDTIYSNFFALGSVLGNALNGMSASWASGYDLKYYADVY